MKERIRRCRGNIFEDLGASPTEAANLKARSHLMTAWRPLGVQDPL